MAEALTEGNDRVANLLPEIERHVGYAIKHGAVGRVWLERHYDLKESEARFVVDYFRDKDLPAPTPVFKEGTKYKYDGINDVYTIFTKKDARPIQFQGREVRDIRRKYSNWLGNDYATVREIANGYPHIHLSDVKELLFSMDIIHDSAPFTDEEILTKKRDELLSELVHQEKGVIAKEYEKKKKKEVTEKARQYDLLMYEQSAKRHELISDLASYVAPREIEKFQHDGNDNLVVLVQPADIHFGKLATPNTTGNLYNREECRKVVLNETYKVLVRATSLGYPSRIHLTLANDWFHIDSMAGTTTKGTRQDIDGIALDIAREGRRLAVEVVELCKKFAPKVVISCVLSNHDLLMGMSLIDYIEAYYNQDADVLVSTSMRPRQYFAYGDTLIGITHEGNKHGGNGLPLLMAQEANELWGQTKHREIFTGHIHTFKSNEVQTGMEHAGVRVWTLPSLSATDHWHELQGYVKNVRAVQAHLLSTTEGHVGFFSANVIDGVREVWQKS